MTAKLVAEEGVLKGLVLSLDEGNEWVLGRDPESSQLLIEDPSVSRKHAIFQKNPQGITVENLSSTNPILVNNNEIHTPFLLSQGDTLSIGSNLFRFYSEIEPQVTHLSGEAISADNEKHDSIFEEEGETGTPSLAEIDLNLMESSRFLLKVVSGPNTGAEFGMQADTSYVIGTDPSACDIVFHDVSVSRQHARLSIKADSLTIEDLKSRNGTLIDGRSIQGKQSLSPNSLVSLGTTTFVVIDREGDRATIISPLMPAIVKTLQQEEEKKVPTESKEEAERRAKESLERELEAREYARQESEKAAEKKAERAMAAFGTLIVVAIISGILAVIGIGTALLFKSETIETAPVDIDKELESVMSHFPTIKYSFNKTTGRLLLVGHVLTSVDRNQLLYNLQVLPFLQSIDFDNVIVDEFIWQETNMVLSKNPAWRGVTLHSPAPGHFVLSGYMNTRAESDQLSDYLSQNFPYLDLLEKKVIVEEELVHQVNLVLQDNALRNVMADVENGDVTLTGNIGADQKTAFVKSIEQIQAIPGVRSIQNQVVEQATAESVINITSEYPVTGFSTNPSGNISVVIKGRILSTGDELDGMKISYIGDKVIFLEKSGLKYRIDYNR
jgi:type III secretion system YscD/HrpQ family protein